VTGHPGDDRLTVWLLIVDSFAHSLQQATTHQQHQTPGLMQSGAVWWCVVVVVVVVETGIDAEWGCFNSPSSTVFFFKKKTCAFGCVGQPRTTPHLVTQFCQPV